MTPWPVCAQVPARQPPLGERTLVAAKSEARGQVPDPAAGEDVEAEVVAFFGPFVVLLGEHGADQPDEGVAVGEDADDVGAPADLAVEPLVVGVDPGRGASLAGWSVSPGRPPRSRPPARCPWSGPF